MSMKPKITKVLPISDISKFYWKRFALKFITEMHFVKDSIHGSIPISELERVILNMPEVYRLHFISQMGFTKFAYPSASHTRFSHSIGVMHIAGEIYRYSLINNKDIAKKFLSDFYNEFLEESFLSRLTKTDIINIFRTLLGHHICDIFHINFEQEEFEQKEILISYFIGLQAVRLSGLLHDVGHLPFSHSSEQIIHENITTINKKPHEYIRDLIIEEIGNRLTSNTKIIQKLKIKSEDKKNLINLIFDIVKKIFTEKEEVLSFFSNIIDGELDADRIDYIVRDGIFTGLFGTGNSIDINRIIMTFSIYNKDNEYLLVPGVQALNDIELLLYKRSKIYDFAVNHHRTRLYNGLVEWILGTLIEKGELKYESFKNFKDLVEKLKEVNKSKKNSKKLMELLIRLNDSVILNDLLLLSNEDSNSEDSEKTKTMTRYLFHHKGQFKPLWKNLAYWKNLHKKLGNDYKKKYERIREVISTLTTPRSFIEEREGTVLFITTIYNYKRVVNLKLRDIKTGKFLTDFEINKELKNNDVIPFYAYTNKNINIIDCENKIVNIMTNILEYLRLSLGNSVNPESSEKENIIKEIIGVLKECDES